MPQSDKDPIDWSLTTWEGAEREQLRRWAALTLEEILLAQEQMQALADRFARGTQAGIAESPPPPEAPRPGDRATE